MIDDRMALIEKSADGDLVREMLDFVADWLMEGDVEATSGAAKGSRSADRINYRNGYRRRAWDTRVGRIDFAIPEQR